MNAKNKSDEEMVSWLALNIVKTFLYFLNNLFSSYWQMASDLNNLQNTNKTNVVFPFGWIQIYMSACVISTHCGSKGSWAQGLQRVNMSVTRAVLTLWQTCGNLSAAFWLPWQHPHCFLLAGLSASSPTTHRMSVNNKHPKSVFNHHSQTAVTKTFILPANTGSKCHRAGRLGTAVNGC